MSSSTTDFQKPTQMGFRLKGTLSFIHILALQRVHTALLGLCSLQPLPHSLHSSYQAPQISFFLLLVIFPPKQNTSHRSSNFMYFSHSQNTMQKNFRVIAEGFVPSSHGKSVGIGILLHFILDIWPLRIFSSLLVLVYCKLHCNSPSTLWCSKEELFLGASRPWGQCLIIIALL